MSGLLSFFVPRDQVFFNLFDRSATNNVQMTELLYKAVCSDLPHNEKMHFNQISRLKTVGNDIKHEVYMRSSRALISPFERNDMYALASVMNQVCDSVHVAARRISLYKLEFVEPAMREIAGILIEASQELDHCVQALRDLKKAPAMADHCKKVKQLEAYADKIYDKAMATIVHTETNSIELIKYTEILAALENASDKCEDATEIIESIIVKNT